MQKRAAEVTEEEKELWDGVNNDLMSDEELIKEGPQSGKWRTSSPVFRSAALSDLCRELDSRMLGKDDPYIIRRVQGPNSLKTKPIKKFKSVHII